MRTWLAGMSPAVRNTLRQVLLRPVPRWNPYTTSDPRLFLCSSSTPPGGGVHGMCGYWAAGTVLRRVFRARVPPDLAIRKACAGNSLVPPRGSRGVLVPWNRDALQESRSAAPGLQGATTENIGHMRGRSNAASRDAPPGNYVTHDGSRGLEPSADGRCRLLLQGDGDVDDASRRARRAESPDRS